MKKITEKGVQYLAPRVKMVDLQCRVTMMVNSPAGGKSEITDWIDGGEDGADE